MSEEEASPNPSEGGEQTIEENDVKRSPPSEGLGGGFNMTHSPPSEGPGEALI